MFGFVKEENIRLKHLSKDRARDWIQWVVVAFWRSLERRVLKWTSGKKRKKRKSLQDSGVSLKMYRSFFLHSGVKLIAAFTVLSPEEMNTMVQVRTDVTLHLIQVTSVNLLQHFGPFKYSNTRNWCIWRSDPAESNCCYLLKCSRSKGSIHILYYVYQWFN